MWSETCTEYETGGKLALQLQPEQAIIIGRQEGGQIDYLDPRYHPTRMVPNTGQAVVTTFGESDRRVSRGHFMLRGSAGGILLVNGVPRRGGGIRPPLNGTVMLQPVAREMLAGEEFLIEHGSTATIRLPNCTVICLGADAG